VSAPIWAECAVRWKGPFQLCHRFDSSPCQHNADGVSDSRNSSVRATTYDMAPGTTRTRKSGWNFDAFEGVRIASHCSVPPVWRYIAIESKQEATRCSSKQLPWYRLKLNYHSFVAATNSNWDSKKPATFWQDRELLYWFDVHVNKGKDTHDKRPDLKPIKTGSHRGSMYTATEGTPENNQECGKRTVELLNASALICRHGHFSCCCRSFYFCTILCDLLHMWKYLSESVFIRQAECVVYRQAAWNYFNNRVSSQ